MSTAFCFQNVNKCVVNVWYLGFLPYQPSYRIQQLLAARHAKSTTSNFVPDTLLIVEHSPVYTVGIRKDNYPISEETRLKALGAEYYKTNRGGLITFHGPGQLVVYPILDLRKFNKSMKWYVCKLEETVIQLCKTLGIEAERSSDTGVWIKNNKICAIGVHGSRYITTHGLALNCNTDMKWFSHIVPCGIYDKGVTSLTHVLERQVTTKEVVSPFLKSFSKEFNCTIKTMELQDKEDIISQLKNENLISNSAADDQLMSELDKLL